MVMRRRSEGRQSALRIDQRHHTVSREPAVLRQSAADDQPGQPAVFLQTVE